MSKATCAEEECKRKVWTKYDKGSDLCAMHWASAHVCAVVDNRIGDIVGEMTPGQLIDIRSGDVKSPRLTDKEIDTIYTYIADACND